MNQHHHLEIRSWFLEPIPHNSNRWTKVRVWGLPTSTTTHKWWRSSSIRIRHSANHLQTRYGTSVRLHGPICKKYASALRMPDHAIRSFARGFPKKWDQLLVQPFAATRRSHRLAASNENIPHSPSVDHSREELPHPKRRVNPPRAASARPSSTAPSLSPLPSKSTTSRLRTSKSTQPNKVGRPSRPTRASKQSKPPKPPVKPAKSVRQPPKPALKSSTRASNVSQPDTPLKRQSRKRVAFADFKQTKPSVPARPRPVVSTPAKVLPAEKWSEAQKDAFERQRNTVPADDPDYWAQVACGVEGKTAEDCQELWESSWVSPAAKKKNAGWAKPPKSPKVSTPEVVMHVRKAATRKRSRNTGKYRSGIRRLTDMIARETSDDLLEPEIVTPKLSGVSLRDGVGKVPALGTDGTPGTEVRRKREKVNQDGELATPELLARGKAFGLQEADRYVSLFKRRLGTCVIPSMKLEGDSKNVTKEARPSKPKFIQTTLLPLGRVDSDNDSQNSEESDLFF